MIDLWTEKWRPKDLNDYVFQNVDQQSQFQDWIREGSIPNLLLTGPAGTGKTTAARMLVSELKIQDYDFLSINASNDTKVEIMREKINNFAATRPFGELKIVLLDEADYLSLNSQALLRNTIESYHETCRFILTANYPHKIIPALHSRCHHIHIDQLDINEFTARAATILVAEQVEFDIDTLDLYVRAHYPDLRKCLNSLQTSSTSGQLKFIAAKSSNTQDFLINAVRLIKQQDLKGARKVICDNFRPDEVENLYRWMYENLDLWSSTDEGQDQALIIIRRAYVNSSMVADQEINLSACFAELASVADK